MIKKSELEAVLIQIEGHTIKEINGQKIIIPVGLLNEECGLGLKRRLRKIEKELMEHLNEYKQDILEVEKIEDQEKKKEERDKLFSETVELKAEKVLMSEIEKINSSFPYDFDLIEHFAQ